ncbi:TetR/AcrR family transcriptional regulator [Reinekea sp. G2M2-21]|uniref:TetR/AcrR family transcriptional regulator n=1 Tax=Reinekea sp. G2M2-21 TaxID=2788942 RepID=UPI0018AA366F|nr:TetR/AcrR family transcriptional regulator [Reinekea sp. G2M2-21]
MSEITPRSEDDKRAALLTAARELFLKNSYANISIRKVADKAKVNSAMIAYYFGSKSGLFREMIKSYIESAMARAQESVEDVNEMNLQDFLIYFYRTVPPELTHLVVRTLVYERSEMRDWILENLMRPALATATKIAENIIDKHGKPVDPLVLRTALQSLMLGPKLLQPILKELHPDEINEEFFDNLAVLNTAMVTSYFELETK